MMRISRIKLKSFVANYERINYSYSNISIGRGADEPQRFRVYIIDPDEMLYIFDLNCFETEILDNIKAFLNID